jgi:ElaB/YqjD/DUF883 family membrane-anchored ribosome-binding protein
MASSDKPGFGTRQEPHGVASAVKDKVEDMASSVASTAEEAWDSTREGIQRAASTAGDAWGEMTGLMRRYPFGTLCVGIGVGFLLSRVLQERRTGDLRRLASELYDRARDYAAEAASKLRT